MVYNREKRTTDIYEADGFDEYGTRTEYVKSGTCDMQIILYSQNNTQDARYKDATHIGYTDKKDIADNMQIEQGGKRYDVLLVNPYGRRCVVFLREV